jgi:hypothetical protein
VSEWVPLMLVGAAPPAGASIREHGLEAIGRFVLKEPRQFPPDLASVNAGRNGPGESGRSSAKKNHGTSASYLPTRRVPESLWAAFILFIFFLVALDLGKFRLRSGGPAMAQSDILSVSTAARDIAGQIFSGGRTWLRPPRSYRALSIQMLPERLRMGFGFPFDEHERRAAALTTINKRLIFLEREKSIGRLRTSR